MDSSTLSFIFKLLFGVMAVGCLVDTIKAPTIGNRYYNAALTILFTVCAA